MHLYYEFSDGTKMEGHSFFDEINSKAEEYCIKNKVEVTRILKGRGQAPRGKMGTRVAHQKDGFKPHFNSTLGKWIETPRQYKKECKRQNLVEVGNEKYPSLSERMQDIDNSERYFTEETIRDIKESGVDVSDNQLEHLRELDRTDNLDQGLNTTKEELSSTSGIED